MKFKQVRSDRLFFDQFEYAAEIVVPEITAIRSYGKGDPIRSDRDIVRVIQERRAFRENFPYRWTSRPTVTQSTIDLVLYTAEWMRQIQQPYKRSVSANRLTIYTSDLELINRIDLDNHYKHKWFREAVVTRTRNTIAHRNPRYNYRAYFNWHEIEATRREQFVNFFTAHQSQCQLNPTMRAKLFESKWRWVNRSDFVDYQDEKWLLMLHLSFPGLVRKVMPIVQAK